MSRRLLNDTSVVSKPRILIACAVALAAWCGSGASAAAGEVDRFGFFEASFEAAEQYANPYTDLDVQAEVKRPDGSTWSIPLFWDGGRMWKLRLSPDLVGHWSYVVHAKDRGLDGETGSFTCVASDRRGSIEPMAEYGHHFQHQDGTPCLFWGDTAWGLYLDNENEQLDRETVFRYIDKRAAEGVNVVHSMMLSEAGWGNSGGVPFHDLAREQINPAYWQEIDARLRHLNDRGIIGGLVIAWGDKQRREPWAWRMFPDLDARKRYARYIAGRYGAFDVFFIVSGEWHAEVRTRDNTTEEEVKREFIEIGRTFAEAEPHDRMIGIHPMTSHGSVREFNETDWMSFGDYQQNYQDLHERILESRRYEKPIVNSEYGYYLRDASGDGKVDKHNSFGPEDMRFATWDILMAGGYPVTGYGTTYMGGYRDPGPFHPDDPRNDIWARQYRLAQRFLTGLHWWKLRPMGDSIRCSQPRSEDRQVRVRMSPTRTRTVRRPPLRTYWLLAEPGRHYVIYARGLSEELTLQLGSEEAGEYRARLYNPRSGVMRPVGNRHAVESQFTWTPPDEGDWVLHLATTNSGTPHTREDRPSFEPITAPWTSPELRLAETISLADDRAGPAERLRLVEGGRFVEDGWQPTGKLDRMILELTDGFEADESGAIELDMTNLDFDAQVNGRKQHFLNLYADPTGDQFNLRNAFFTLRGGNYRNDAGHRGIKVLWRGGHFRGEHAPYAARPTWDPNETYTWRAEWNEDELVVFLNGERVFGPAKFQDRDPARPLCHIFLSRDGCLNEDLWFGFPGPVYEQIRLFRAAEKTQPRAGEATQWMPMDLVFTAEREHTWKSFPMQAVFTNGRRQLTLDAFWDGGKRWVVRFAPPTTGRWMWKTISEDPGLGGKEGHLIVRPPTSDQSAENANLRGHVKASPNGHYFQYADGTPVLVIADTKWGFNSTGHRVEDGAWDHFVTRRLQQGFNTLCLRIWSNDSPNEGGQAFLDNDGRPGNGRFEDLNPAFFQNSDRRARILWDHGFILAAFPDWFGKIRISVEDARHISRYMLSRWNAFNLLWALSGEYHRNFVKDIAPWNRWGSWHAVGRCVQEHNPYNHPVSAHPSPWGNHPEGQVSTSMDLQDSGWLDHHWMQSKRWDLFNRIPLYGLHDYHLEPARPTLFMEGLYETQDDFGLPDGIEADAYHIRLQGWASLLSGAAGTIYGHDRARGGRSYRPEMLDAPGAEDFTHLSTFFRNIEWWRLVPHRDWILVDGRVLELQEDARQLVPYLAAISGELYVTYIPRGYQHHELTLMNLGLQNYDAEWYNPRTGDRTRMNKGGPLKPDAAGRWKVPACPDDEDWVLVLEIARDS